MMASELSARTRLQQYLAMRSSLAVAVSGGVDSLTLATVAALIPKLKLTVIHALSPAVPAAATQRVRKYAQIYNWKLIETNAGEYNDPDYRANPINRCYFCKNNLYQRIRGLTDQEIASGTNLDDLGDFRPGLLAAQEWGIVHPFVETMITKDGIRTIAASLGLEDIAELPAQPCLASRVETGIPIVAQDLAFIETVEAELASWLSHTPLDVRCRITADGVWIELDSAIIDQKEILMDMDIHLHKLCANENRVYAGCRSYQKGSSFLHDK